MFFLEQILGRPTQIFRFWVWSVSSYYYSAREISVIVLIIKFSMILFLWNLAHSYILRIFKMHFQNVVKIGRLSHLQVIGILPNIKILPDILPNMKMVEINSGKPVLLPSLAYCTHIAGKYHATCSINSVKTVLTLYLLRQYIY